MIIKLNKGELFWSMINPVDVEHILVILNESAPEATVEFEKLPKWAQKQIETSVKLKKISTEPDVASIAANKVEAIAIQEVPKKKVSKKVSKKVTAKAIE